MVESRIIEGSRPDPDPTLLTTASLLREIANLKELVSSNIATLEARTTTRLDNIEKRLDHKYLETATDIKHLHDLHEEKFLGLSHLNSQSREDGKVMLDAAFKSAKDAQDKTEQSFTKQIESLASRSEDANKATNEKIDRLTSRLDSGEGQTKGKTEGVGTIGSVAVGAAFIISSLVSVAALILSLSHH
jgi:hypothetical protein